MNWLWLIGKTALKGMTVDMKWLSFIEIIHNFFQIPFKAQNPIGECHLGMAGETKDSFKLNKVARNGSVQGRKQMTFQKYYKLRMK